MSAIRYAMVRKLPNKIFLLFGNRTEQDIIYAKELSQIHGGQVCVVHILEQPSAEWKGERGRIGRAVIERYIPLPLEKLWYVCGPPPMIKAMKEILKSLHVPEQNWRIETWELPGKSSSSQVLPQ
jgi:NAD(P)H-flavin reductase